MTRRIVIWIAAVLSGAWLALALLVSACLGWSGRSLLVGLKTGPAIVAELLTPTRNDLPPLPNLGDGLSPADGRRLHDLVVSRGYRRALDVGTGDGHAALWLGMAMRATGGKVVTIEIDPVTATRARDHIRAARLDDVIDLRVNDALREIPATPGSFDFVFLDLGGARHDELFELIDPRLAPGGAIVSHNACGLRFTSPGYLPAVSRRADLKTGILPTLSGGLAVSVKAAAE